MENREVLQHLRRQYSKDEAIAAANFEIGVLQTEIAELRDKVEYLQKQLALQEELKEDGFYKMTDNSNSKFYVTMKKYNKQVKLVEHFINLYHSVK